MKERKKMDSKSRSCPPLCARGCGFFGSAENQNLCSKCYRDYLKEETAKSSKTPAPPPNSIDDKKEICEASVSGSDPIPIMKNRCEQCNKKVGLTGFKCRCGKLFCGTHRYPKEHSCNFDFKSVDRQLLATQNPIVKVDKLHFRI